LQKKQKQPLTYSSEASHRNNYSLLITFHLIKFVFYGFFFIFLHLF